MSMHSLGHDSVQQKEAQICLTPDADHACILLHQAEACKHTAAHTWELSSSCKRISRLLNPTQHVLLEAANLGSHPNLSKKHKFKQKQKCLA